MIFLKRQAAHVARQSLLVLAELRVNVASVAQGDGAFDRVLPELCFLDYQAAHLALRRLLIIANCLVRDAYAADCIAGLEAFLAAL